MAAVRRLKSSLKLGSKDNDDHLRVPSRSALKGSNAKLQKSRLDSFVFDVPDGEHARALCSPFDLPVLPPPKPFKVGHLLRPCTNDSLVSIAQPTDSIPSQDGLEPDVLPTFTRTDSKQCELNEQKRKSRSLSKFFGKGKPKTSYPDNFTQWDSERLNAYQSLHGQPYGLAASRGDSALASAILRIGAVAAGPSNAQEKPESSESNPFHEAQRARMSWRREHLFPSDDESEKVSTRRSKQKAKRQAICDIDWNDYEDGEAVRDLIDSYDIRLSYENNDISPVDSGIGLDQGDERPPVPDKGKGRVIEPSSTEPDEDAAQRKRLDEELRTQLGALRESLGERVAEFRARQEALLEQYRERDSELKAAEELAKRLARQEREEQEEADRLHAQALADEETRLAAELLKPRECVCCGDDIDPSSFPPHPPTYACAHDPQTCTTCMHSWIASEISTKGVSDLKCPECPETLTYPDVQRLATPETFQTYEKLLVRAALGSIEAFSWCLNPTGCCSGQENTSNNNFMECVVCKYRQCLKHKCAWHVDETCEEYDYRTSGARARDEEAKTLEVLDAVSKKCPGEGCGWRIQKSEGCDHMTCRKCRWEFCWECLASHREIKRVGNEAHLEWCKFHSKNLETTWPFNMHA